MVQRVPPLYTTPSADEACAIAGCTINTTDINAASPVRASLSETFTLLPFRRKAQELEEDLKIVVARIRLRSPRRVERIADALCGPAGRGVRSAVLHRLHSKVG